MKTKHIIILILILSSLSYAHDYIPGENQTNPILLKGGNLYTIADGLKENTDLLFENGRITKIERNLTAPTDCKIIDISGQNVYPGLIAPNSSLGLVEIGAVEASVDTTLELQNEESGGFALDGTSGACEDIDAAFILVNAYLLSDYRRADIRASMARVLDTILEHQNPDGGLVYLRGKPYLYGTELMSSGIDQSAFFPSWFRLLSVALINQIVPHPKADPTPWRFNNCGTKLRFGSKPCVSKYGPLKGLCAIQPEGRVL